MTKRHVKQLLRAAIETAKHFPLSPAETAEFVEDVRDSRRGNAIHARRRAERVDVDGLTGTLSCLHPGGSAAAARCVVLDVSATGAGVLYPGFVYPQSPCGLYIRDAGGETRLLMATVIWCRLISRSVHSVGVRFDEEADLRSLVPPEQWREQLRGSASDLAPPVRGRLLMIDFEEPEQAMLQLFLREIDPNIAHVAFDGAALDSIRQGSYDALLIDADAPQCGREGLIERIRSEGCTAPVIAVTRRPELVQGLGSCASTEAVIKPVERELLLAVIGDQLRSQADPLAGAQPIFSTLPDLDGADTPVCEYIDRCRKHAHALQESLTAGNTAEALRLAVTLRNTAAGYGFDPLGVAADRAVDAIEAAGSVHEASVQVRLLLRTIARLQPPPREGGDA